MNPQPVRGVALRPRGFVEYFELAHCRLARLERRLPLRALVAVGPLDQQLEQVSRTRELGQDAGALERRFATARGIHPSQRRDDAPES